MSLAQDIVLAELPPIDMDYLELDISMNSPWWYSPHSNMSHLDVDYRRVGTISMLLEEPSPYDTTGKYVINDDEYSVNPFADDKET